MAIFFRHGVSIKSQCFWTFSGRILVAVFGAANPAPDESDE
jgi:hypothetical protein